MNAMNLLPEDYVERRAQQRANILCLVLFSVVMAAVVGATMVTERQAVHRRQVREQVNRDYAEAGRLIAELQDLEEVKADVLAKARIASDLREAVLRSYLLAAVTNAMPEGTSLRRLTLRTEVLRNVIPPDATKFDVNARTTDGPIPATSFPIQTRVEVVGLAGTDMQVAQFINYMSRNPLVDQVELEYSEQADYMDAVVREFSVVVELRINADMDLLPADEPIEQLENTRAAADLANGRQDG